MLCLLVSCKDKPKTQKGTETLGSEYIASEIISLQQQHEDSIEARLLDDRLSAINDSIDKVSKDKSIKEADKKKIVYSLRQEVRMLTAKWDTVR